MTTNAEDATGVTTGGTQRLAEAAGGIAEQAGSVAERQASTTMTQVGDTLEQLARAVRDAGEGLRTDQPQIAGIADTAAEQVERASLYLRDHDAREVIESAQDFARRQPAIVVGAGLALGLLVGRALKSAGGTTRRASGQYGQYGEYGDYGSSGSSGQYGQYGRPRESVQFGYGESGGYGSSGGPGRSDAARRSSGTAVYDGTPTDLGSGSSPAASVSDDTEGR